MTKKKLLIVQVAALSHRLAEKAGARGWTKRRFSALPSELPGVTCTAQATFRTAMPPSGHGMPANGFFDRTLRRTYFWEQSSALVEGARIWDNFRAQKGTVGLLFIQQSLGENVDCILSPAPVHKHHGGIMQDCYSKPMDLYVRLCKAIGEPFPLAAYWGPGASTKSSQWIAKATRLLLKMEGVAPDVVLTYLPALDYDLQRFGPDSPQADAALQEVCRQIEDLAAAAEENGYALLVWGDYAIEACPRGPVYINRVLAGNGLLRLRRLNGMTYPDLHASDAFCVADHEIGMIYLKDPSKAGAVADLIGKMDGVGNILPAADQQKAGVHCKRSGDLLVVADEGAWIAYPWWESKSEAPDYASHVDIHSKPGYDPCELFHGWHPFCTGTDAGKVMGSHGRSGKGRETAFCTAGMNPGSTPVSLSDLAACVRKWLE